ncbi:hypothetical protein F5B22DRAFT_597956 [Xylaria bambusicola]|uniref:uncharacterized protein n=1 Tax=Xylaria bambusicola TaxID=326684 RepID=UPI002007AD86|nr:uncharacterized protein F5B22DRAFT_597956 [Xylaria bambusicola]KAI0521172.1 hypothetical protein F5B22DRAFT_597956 [Xylaria bambusicola]
MATKSDPIPWADGPFSLIETPSVKRKSDHFYLKAATEMAHAHNVLIRSLNAILRQGPHIPTSTDPKYCAKDVADFLNYVRCWVQMVHHHHWVEEEFIFPEMGKFSGKPGLMDEPRHQHESFQAGLTNLESYSINTKPEQFEWKGPQGMERIIGSFSEQLTGHLYDEIEVLLTMGDLDSEEFKKTWLKAETIAKQSGNLKLLVEMVPLVLGSADKTYEGGEDFPPFPWFMPYVAHYGLAARNGSWRFNPCDFWGKPRPLAFGDSSSSIED